MLTSTVCACCMRIGMHRIPRLASHQSALGNDVVLFQQHICRPMLCCRYAYTLSQFLLIMVSMRRCRVAGFNTILRVLGVHGEYPSERADEPVVEAGREQLPA